MRVYGRTRRGRLMAKIVLLLDVQWYLGKQTIAESMEPVTPLPKRSFKKKNKI